MATTINEITQAGPGTWSVRFNDNSPVHITVPVGSNLQLVIDQRWPGLSDSSVAIAADPVHGRASAVLATAFQRPQDYSIDIIRQRVEEDAKRIGAAVWPNGLGFDISDTVEVCYNDGRPWVTFKAAR